MDRRRFLRVLGVTGGGAAALSGCGTDSVEKLIPMLVTPDEQVPGIATYYASTCRECPAGCGVHARVREGRAVKVEGNPDSPVNRGRLCSRGQASLQGLYNPDRVRQPMVNDGSGGFTPISWDDAIARVVQQLSQAEGSQVAFLTGNETGTFNTLVDNWLRSLGSNQRVVFEPFGYEALRAANRMVFGVDVLPQHHFERAEFVMSFGADFLETWLSPVQYAGTFAEGHAFHDGHAGRYVHVEPRMSMTAFSADEWIAPTPGTEGLLALGMAKVVMQVAGAEAPSDASLFAGLLDGIDLATVADQTGVEADAISRLAAEFAESPSIAVAGGTGAQHDASGDTAAAVAVLNYVAGNVGETIVFGENLNPDGGSTYQGLADLVGAMSSGNVSVLFVHGANPVYASPQGLGVAAAIGQVPFTVSFSRYLDETSSLADLVLPDHDPLEQWNDYVPRMGVVALQQPVMQPVFDTRQTGDVLLQVAAAMDGVDEVPTYKGFLEASWLDIQQNILNDPRPFPQFWTESLRRGGAYFDPSPVTVRLAPSAAQLSVQAWQPSGSGMALIAYPSPAFFDGRGANKPWLQELADPVTKVTWSSWVEIGPETAEEMGIAEGEFVEVTSPNGTVTAPAYVYPGIAPNVVAMPIGQGHTAFGRYATDRGANAFHLLASEPTAFGGLSFYTTVQLVKTGAHERFPSSAGVPRQLGRGLSQSTTLHDIEEGHFHTFHIEHAAEVPEHIEHILEEWQERQTAETERGNYAGEHPNWGLAVDLSRCTGCSACVTACYAENNLATVGDAELRRGRDMAWLRIERYYEGGGEEPLKVDLLPMMCQQCGRAPCEPVCPVFAAYRTPDGLNGQVYNRCVGTRYCSNNCPYKVRYFNWFDHGNPIDAAFSWPAPLQMLLNPDVTVRSKGVMEKCTFCVQRIRGVQNTAAVEGRDIRDGEIQTACQQTCPANALVFGDLNDPNSEVSRTGAGELGYRVFEGLNTDPGVTYLTRVRNTVEA